MYILFHAISHSKKMKFMSIFWSTAPIAHISLITKIKSPDKLRLRRKKGREPVACDLDVTPEGLEPSTH